MSNVLYSKVTARLRARGLSLGALARAVSLSHPTLTSHLNEPGKLTLDEVERLETALGVQPGWVQSSSAEDAMVGLDAWRPNWPSQAEEQSEEKL